MSDDRPDRCDRCRYFELIEAEEGTGNCRRYPPAIFPEASLEAGLPRDFGWWPDVAEADWCGEFQPIPIPIPKDPGRGMRAVANPAPGSVPTE